MESFGKVNLKILTLAALMSLGLGSEVKGAGRPVVDAEKMTVDYKPVDEVISTQPAKKIEKFNVYDPTYTKADYEGKTSGHSTEVRHTQKTATVESGGHTYTVEISYTNDKPTQYKFTDKDSLKTVTTIDGGQEMLIGDSVYHDTKIDTLADGTTQTHDLVLGRAAHMDVTRPDGRPDVMIIKAKNGTEIKLQCKYHKDGTPAKEWQVFLNGNVTPANDEAKMKLINQMLNSHTLMPLKFKKEGSKLVYTGVDQASN